MGTSVVGGDEEAAAMGGDMFICSGKRESPRLPLMRREYRPVRTHTHTHTHTHTISLSISLSLSLSRVSLV
jgi:hypothetical protein